ncbi:MAG: alpha/beta hydrolase fold domain-containing protein, partial [Desulfotomaculales bacterium]
MKCKLGWFFTVCLCIFMVLIFTPVAFAAPDQSQPQFLEVQITRPSVAFISDVVYEQPAIFGYSSIPLRMDLLVPVSKNPLPAVLFIPGGGFMSANKDKLLQERITIAEAGYVVASIEYRVTPQSVFPAALEDVKTAVRYLRANASKYNIDVNHIAVMGNSAGGYLAALAGTTNGVKEFEGKEYPDQSSEVQAVIDLYGLSDLTQIGYGFPEKVQKAHASPSAPEGMWLHGAAIFSSGGSVFDDPQKAAWANPITYVTEDDPPFLIFHGDKDVLVSPYESKILHEALVKKGVESTYYIVKNAGHGTAHFGQPIITDLIIKFLNKHLKKGNRGATPL